MRLIWRRPRAFLCGMILSAMVATAGLSNADEPRSNQSELESIRKAAQQYLEAVEKGDHAKMKSFWTPEGDFIDQMGRRIKPAKITQETVADGTSLVERGAESGQRMHIRIESTRMVTADVAIEDGISEITPPPADRPAIGRFTAVWVKRNGKWLIDSVRAAPSHIPHHQYQLQQLEWMVGDWVEAGDAAAITMKCRWSSDNSFLLRQIRIQPKERDAHVVTQRLGWDPVAGKIRSWIFDSDGGFGEGYWTREGDRWVVTSKSTLPDGKQATGTTINMLVDDSDFMWESVNYVVDGQKMPDLRVKLVRQEETSDK